MTFSGRKTSEKAKQNAAETAQIKDAASILKEGTEIPGKENIFVSDKTADKDSEDYDDVITEDEALEEYASGENSGDEIKTSDEE